MSIRVAINYIRAHLDTWKAAAARTGFDPVKHPRDKHGKFTNVGPPPDRSDKVEYKRWLQALIRENYNHGASRMESVYKKLTELYPKSSDSQIYAECYLCDNLGRRLTDPVSGQARRVDFLVVQGGKAVRSIEVTSHRASKTTQMNKEKRIRKMQRESGKDLYAQIKGGDVVKINYSLKTRVWRTEDFAA